LHLIKDNISFTAGKLVGDENRDGFSGINVVLLEILLKDMN